jgi:hypothetical protein
MQGKGLLVAAVTAALVVGAVWMMTANEPHGTPPGETPSEPPREAPDEGQSSPRERLLHGTPQQMGITPVRGVWGVIMERGYPKGTATVIALADGTASMYLSTGGAVVGGRAYPPAHAAALKMCNAAADALAETIVAHEFPHPAKGRVRFYVLADDGVRVTETDLLVRADAGRDALAPLLATGDALLDALRDATSKGLIR